MSDAPGWYPDPEARDRLRYWDGRGWTPFDVRAPALPSTEGLPGRHGRVLLIVASVLVLLFVSIGVIGGTVSGDNADRDSAGSANDADAAGDEEPTEGPSPTPEPTPTTTAVPSVTGLTVAQARDEIRESGLDVGSIQRRTSVKKPGTVLRQTRRAASELALGSSIGLVVAGPWPAVPRTGGLSSSAAIKALKRAGFRVSTTERRTTSGRDGMVLSQLPTGGRRLKPNSTIRLVVADLRKPPPPPPPLASNCSTGYSPCLPFASDYDCAGGSGDGPEYATGPIRVTGSDPYELDSEGDGVACE